MEMCSSFHMTEFEDQSDADMASDFIVGTCQLLPKSFSDVSDHLHNVMIIATPALIQYAINCGSIAEFYIRPLNSCIADIDFLISSAEELAYSGDFPLLPSDMSGLADTIQCYKIEPYQRYQGFARLRFSGEMIYNWKNKRYEFNRLNLIDNYKTLDLATIATDYKFDHMTQGIVSGPAIKYHTHEYYIQSSSFDTNLSGDFVRSVWCPKWPREAQNWRIRPRYQRWPTIDTISEVLQNG